MRNVHADCDMRRVVLYTRVKYLVNHNDVDVGRRVADWISISMIVPSSSLVAVGVPDQYALHMLGAGYVLVTGMKILTSSVIMYPG
jgi:hypothetical protein